MDRLGNAKSWIPWVYLALILASVVSLTALYLDLRDTNAKIRGLVRKNTELVHQNRHRIAEIQRSRLESCSSNLEGIRKVFRPFFPKHPTAQERANLKLFNNRIDQVKKDCKKLVTPPAIKTGSP